MKKSKPKGCRSFDSVPADDGFRNYMSRKIELQRKQFGLVLPPPPDSPIETSQNSDGDKHLDQATTADYSASNDESERNEASAGSSGSPSRKSVRFHTNLELVAPITSVSDVLENLKQRHSVKKSSLRRRRYGGSEKRDYPTNKAQSTSTSASMEVVLNKLHSRYDRSLKRKHSKSILETLDTCDDLNCSEENTPTTQFDDVQTAKPWTQIDTLSTEIVNNLLDAGDCDFDMDHQSKSTKPLHIASVQTDVNQATGLVKKSSNRPDLFFTGVVVLVNGHTNPDATTLMRLLHKHGGDLEKYETRRVTHIIAERLSTAKANIYKSQKNPTPVVRPEWITDSVENGLLLPFGDYLLEDVMGAKTPGTKSLKTFFGSEKASDKEMEVNRWADIDPSKSNYHINGQVRTVGNDPNFLES
jgi:DNA repair protein REV1